MKLLDFSDFVPAWTGSLLSDLRLSRNRDGQARAKPSFTDMAIFERPLPHRDFEIAIIASEHREARMPEVFRH